MISHSCAALSEPYQPYLPLSEPCPANLTLKLHQTSELTPFSRYHVTFMLHLRAGPGPGLGFRLALAPATLLETRRVCLILFLLALRPLLRAWPQWAHQAALVNADVRVSILSCHGHPQAASAAAWLNNSSSLVYSPFLAVSGSQNLNTAPSQVQLPWLPTPSPIRPPEICSRTGPCILTMNYSGLIWLQRW